MAERDLHPMRTVALLLRRWRLIFMVCLLTGAGTAVVNFFFLPHWYRSTAVIMPPQDNSSFSGLGMLLSRIPDLPGGISRIASGIGAMSQSQYLFVVILNSRTVADSLIDKFDLQTVYDSEYRFLAREELQGHTWIDFPPEGQVVITVEAKEDPQLARDMAAEYFVQLNNILTDRGIHTAGTKRQFLEERIEETRAQLTIFEDSLRSFQEDRNLVVPAEEPGGVGELLLLPVRGNLEMLALIEAKREVMSVELRVMQSYYRSRHPDIAMLKKEINELDRTIAKIESQMPQISLDFARIFRDLKVQEELLLLLTAQYEETRINEADDTPSAVLLDEPVVPEYKYRPRRLLNTAIASAAALLLVCVAIVLAERYREQNDLA
ncbi:MAG: hypothetical protein FVQ81_05695 [Candidatus Glassbacteria bacterium]|nr:hypothetical protein [Candidatus Glassbacteria bacterium]